MSDTEKRIVQQHDAGGWEVRKPGSSRASDLAPTQAAGVAYARDILRNVGGGELQIRAQDGTIRAQDTIPPGNDPRRSKG